MKRIVLKVLKVVLVLMVFFLFTNMFLSKTYSQENIWNKEDGSSIITIAQAGGKGEFPANSLLAIENSVALGINIVELDVLITSDNYLITAGDVDKEHFGNCIINVEEKTYEWLFENCNIGFDFENEENSFPYMDVINTEWENSKIQVIKLEDVFSEFANDIRYQIDLNYISSAKIQDAYNILSSIAEDNLIPQVLVDIKDDTVVSKIDPAQSNLYIITPKNQTEKLVNNTFTFTSFMYKPGEYAVVQVESVITLTILENLKMPKSYFFYISHKHNLSVFTINVNSTNDMNNIINSGCDGIATDFPSLLVDALSNN